MVKKSLFSIAALTCFLTAVVTAEYATDDMKKLNTVHMDAPDGAYNFNVFS